MAFAAHFGFSPPTSGALQAQQLMLTTKTAGSQSSPGVVDGGRGLIPADGRGMLPGEGLSVGAAIPYLSRMAGLPESVYAQAAMTAPGLESSAFYALNGAAQGISVDRSHELWKNLHHQSPVLYPFDPMMATHPYGAFYGGFDLNNAARRKNATRETTSALKAWLYEHRKNPYPTKGEKIMLAIITKMTLTQVSTWFANARRRLKKESKVGWSKDKDIDDNDDSDVDVDGRGTADDSDDEEKRTTGVAGSRHFRDEEDEDIHVTTSDLSDISDTDDDRCTRPHPNTTPLSQSKQLFLNFNRATETSPLFVPQRYLTTHSAVSRTGTSHSVSSNISHQINPKPKIWSIADFVNSSSKPADRSDNRTVQGCEMLSERRTTPASNDTSNIPTGSEASHTERPTTHAHKHTGAESAQGKALNLSLGEKEKTHEDQSTSRHTDSGSSNR